MASKRGRSAQRGGSVSTWYTLYCLDCKADACEGTTYNLSQLSAVGNQAELLHQALRILGKDSPFEVRMDGSWFPDSMCDDEDDVPLVPFALAHYNHHMAIRDEYGHVHQLDEPYDVIGEMYAGEAAEEG